MVLIISVLVTNSSKKVVLEKIFYIKYLVIFQKNEEKLKVLLNSGNKINAMSLNFTQKLGLIIQKTSVKAQKIDSFTLKIFKMIIIDF